MTLATHGLIGAAVARLFPANPVWGLCAGIASHFIADHIPHWDYSLLSSKIDPQRRENDDFDFLHPCIVRDSSRVALDLFLGIGVPLIIFQPNTLPTLFTILLGAIGGILPDPLQIVYFKLRHEPLRSFYFFHKWCHARLRIHAPVLGLVLQGAIAASLATITVILSPL